MIAGSFTSQGNLLILRLSKAHKKNCAGSGKRNILTLGFPWLPCYAGKEWSYKVLCQSDTETQNNLLVTSFSSTTLFRKNT